ncbi:putative DsbA family dithiol-disulfide isomerase [Labrenzia sp. EL_208]|uniref:Protein-disulfide isomerase n=1 Tax=Roseibium album TaxID=311410 RepID=A0A0M7ASV1_9HYPH|nr:DsbA family oxidoreductase [Roseibium album]MBG6143738.1 putative DsbA family dithiol-disulfide isomerase [Labrenzia sp. EL_142]MBG6156203.1 putative DsbA family dithiol-disulfide isomerase [Labrenzia sp. EL_162]MBG6163994.1 putative DsbA family dithiol-disulfide isomerase [Labrenzia sp. EL_195]MBG6176842.1 putative DsbA family dithiol-disulfide isomerase [Labrenzia sp. EL_132]MBG6194736.1 putative DsbA family dithiol-disulfide isomerase [Labrenzia sp. EL_159]MBG6200333.1 putative DsbA fam
MNATPPLTVDVVSDVMCPWCFIGKRRLETALRSVPQLNVDVRWHPFQLDATLPKSGKDRQQYLDDKFGGKENADAVYSRIKETGAEEGINFAFDKIKLSPNTLDSHRLILWSRSDNVQSDVVERLFKAYFLDGEDLTKAATLVRISEEAGMQSDLVEQLLETETDLDKTEAQITRASESGISGVPCFIIDGRFVLAGAEKPETIAAALQHAEETRTDPEAEQSG